MKQIIINNISTSYYITEDGRCYNSNTNKYLKGQENYKNHYFSYHLRMPDGSCKKCYAHRLVAEAYLPKPKYKNQTQINHIDGNKLNNCADNLEWCTPAENAHHASMHELKKVDHVFCFNKDKILVAEYKNIPTASVACGISTGELCKALCQTENKSLVKGFYWSRNRVLESTKEYPNVGKAKKVNQYDLNGKYIKTYNSVGEAGRALGLKRCSHISECCRGKIKSYKGFVWRYVDDIVSPSSES